MEESPHEEVRDWQNSKFVEYFDSIISASLTHDGVDNQAIEYQKHNHTFSCYKNKKATIVIKENEGFGKHTWLGDSMEVAICRHNFPKFPIPETTILKEYNETERKNIPLMTMCKANLDKIHKYILLYIKENLEEF